MSRRNPLDWFRTQEGALRFPRLRNQAVVEIERPEGKAPELVVRVEFGSNVEQVFRDLAHVAESLRVASLRQLPYEEYLKSQHWQETRQRAIEAAAAVCGYCFRRNIQLHVHHLTYERLGEERPDDLLVLCADCHERMHSEHGAAMMQHLPLKDMIRQVARGNSSAWH